MWNFTPRKKAMIYQVTTMLSTLKMSYSHNHLLTTSADDPTLKVSSEHQRVKGHQHRWLASGYDLEIGHFYDIFRWIAWWLAGW